MNKLTIGKKIRLFRKKANISQLELELKIDAASGSISRIENGDTNPSKETLIKIIEALKLSPKDAAILFNINVEEDIAKLVNVSRNLNSLDLDQVIKSFVNEFIKELNLLSALVWIKDEDIYKPSHMTNSWYTELVFKLLPTPLSLLKISIENPKLQDNLIAKAARDKKTYFSESLADFGRGILPIKILETVEKIIGIKISIAIPIVIEDDRCVGVFTASSDNLAKLKNEIPLLEAFTNQVSATINNIYKYNSLQEELNKFKNGNI